MSKALKEVIIKNLESILEDVTVATTQSDGDKVYLKYWYRDDVFTCFLLSDFTLQVSSLVLVLFCLKSSPSNKEQKTKIEIEFNATS